MAFFVEVSRYTIVGGALYFRNDGGTARCIIFATSMKAVVISLTYGKVGILFVESWRIWMISVKACQKYVLGLMVGNGIY